MIPVCHITTVHPLLDDRIFYKECVSLAKAGFDVSLVVTHSKAETIDGVKIIPLKESRGRLNRIFVKSFVAFRKALKTKAKLYHFHDPELIFIGILLRVWGKKVIFDSHENVSKQISSKSWIGNKIIRNLVSFFYRGIEKFGIWTFNGVISVTPEIVSFLSKKKGVLIRNFPIVSMIDNAPALPKASIPTLIYAGGLTTVRGIKEICEAVSMIEQPIQLNLLGPWESDRYKDECLKQSPKNINYLGMIPMEEVYPHLKAADIGLATLYAEKNYLNSLPIKAFEYMASGIPLIMSDFPYWKKEFNNFALFVDPKNPTEIKSQIELLLSDKTFREKLGAKGKQTVLEQYSWESESKQLVNMYQHILS